MKTEAYVGVGCFRITPNSKVYREIKVKNRIVIAAKVVFGMSSVSAFAAVVGDLYPTPDEGWKRIEMIELYKYVERTGTWQNQSPDYPDGILTYDPSATYSFKFKGDKIRFTKLYTDSWTSQALHVKVDGKDYHSQTFTEMNNSPYLAIEVLDLADGVHTVEVLGTYVAKSSKHLAVYAIDIPERGYVIGEKGQQKLSVLLNESETVQLSISYNLADNTNLTWVSDDEPIATVDANGKVTAVAVGEIDVTVQNADATYKESIPVKVLEMADEQRLAVHLKPQERAKLYLIEDPTTVTWKSFDESIVTVDATGQLTGVAKGLAIVQAELDGEIYQVYVRVNG